MNFLYYLSLIPKSQSRRVRTITGSSAYVSILFFFLLQVVWNLVKPFILLMKAEQSYSCRASLNIVSLCPATLLLKQACSDKVKQTKKNNHMFCFLSSNPELLMNAVFITTSMPDCTKERKYVNT